jgi:hypothetical protein
VRRAIGVINRRGDEEWFAHGLDDLYQSQEEMAL